MNRLAVATISPSKLASSPMVSTPFCVAAWNELKGTNHTGTAAFRLTDLRCSDEGLAEPQGESFDGEAGAKCCGCIEEVQRVEPLEHVSIPAVTPRIGSEQKPL